MQVEIFPFSFEIDSVAIAGTGLWATGLYLGFLPLSHWLIDQCCRWFDFAERSLYLSAEEFEKSRPGREAQNAFWASIFSISPFLVMGALCYYLSVISFGTKSWGISLGLIAVIGGGVYALGRRDGKSRE
ncbi:hypothetical protein GS597_14715 [Synechococcales cyanobacterium C]|uniref:Uncharacterized protein n=2 Tax=Petrachloros TaxID=2918834 RepID=A0A8K2A0X0_9CYAN|nr:hypothetical protein [Petrachloros mirabilis]NCJ07738.1 hypothetical protein [Petrachloros mirabilis ULC683]